MFFAHEGKKQPKEKEKVAGVLAGAMADPSWNVAPSAFDFFDGKGVVESLARELALPKLRFRALAAEDAPFLQPGRAAEVLSGGTVLGWATTMFNAGYMLAAVISGLVVKAYGLPAVYRTDAVLMVVLAVSSLLIVRMATRHRDRLRIAAGGGENGIPQPTSGGRDK